MLTIECLHAHKWKHTYQMAYGRWQRRWKKWNPRNNVQPSFLFSNASADRPAHSVCRSHVVIAKRAWPICLFRSFNWSLAHSRLKLDECPIKTCDTQIVSNNKIKLVQWITRRALTSIVIYMHLCEFLREHPARLYASHGCACLRVPVFW